MDDDRIWAFEESLWIADAEHYRQSIDEACLMVLPASPYVFTGAEAIEAVSRTPRWAGVELTERQVARPEHGLIVIAYRALATRGGATPYDAHCTSTYRRLAPERWVVVQHQQTPPLALEADKAQT